MLLSEKLARIKESEIAKLVFNGQVLGLRVKFFNVGTEHFEYYDFDLEVIRDKTLIKFIRSIDKCMRQIQLKRVSRNGENLLVSDEEIKYNQVVQEFRDEADAVRVLTPFIRIYRAKSSKSTES